MTRAGLTRDKFSLFVCFMLVALSIETNNQNRGGNPILETRSDVISIFRKRRACARRAIRTHVIFGARECTSSYFYILDPLQQTISHLHLFQILVLRRTVEAHCGTAK